MGKSIRHHAQASIAASCALRTSSTPEHVQPYERLHEPQNIHGAGRAVARWRRKHIAITIPSIANAKG
jgi:hypothetical protein